MAEKEKKTDLENTADEKAAKAEKVKSDKPSFTSRISAWYKSLKSECKKVSWANWNSVRSNSIVVIVCAVIFAVALGLADLILMGAISGLSKLI